MIRRAHFRYSQFNNYWVKETYKYNNCHNTENGCKCKNSVVYDNKLHDIIIEQRLINENLNKLMNLMNLIYNKLGNL